ncbi:hypothetical protein GCM10010112_84440 [Actinoplanes lobatus]|uniref:Uncharacterized protein n=1 Tax=Actinoplanes lobatus TaxID=113568 RepID=A0A7W7MJ99_9ACTN|nr:hypothetical protein [Actinoplanes lobatus]GGN94755.1 hypothetical protein GCM10010112_84440 [Actinoplanes lobatus]GIE45608.1 hypothetical protein Alo02nite_85060 [Actinoplanes lobatus]
MSEASGFLIPVSAEGAELLRDIADDMVARFHVTPAEAIARINYHWRGQNLEAPTDLVFHQTADYWADRIYHEDVFEDGRTSRVPRPAPAADSGCWPVSDRRALGRVSKS